MPGSEVYPQSSRQRDRWIVALRPDGNSGLDPRRAYASLAEQEPDEIGNIIPISTIFLTNRQCPWRCAMCDLWKNTLPTTVPPGAIVEQIDAALARLPPARQVKLYNAGSFFDPGAIPPADHPAIAERMHRFERVIVECHPALVGPRVIGFRERLGTCALEIAMGLETVHPDALERLNKRMTVDQFMKAARFLRENRIALRVFLLIHPPFIKATEQATWLRRSIEIAFDSGASVVSLIPTRGGNGAMEQLALAGQFTPPTLMQIGAAFQCGLAAKRGRVYVDLWDLKRSADCRDCFAPRRDRLAAMNLEQRVLSQIDCQACAIGAEKEIRRG